jgi:catechol 2,3-dioxygenase-like lactoylglutathione lyase family enzyme
MPDRFSARTPLARALAATAATVLLLTAARAEAPAAALIGHGRGVDHVGIAVRDLDQARADFATLGFRTYPGGAFPGGAHNAVVPLSDRFFIELITAPADATGDGKYIHDFAAQHEGGMFLGLNVSSAKATADYLRARGVDARGPEPGGAKAAQGPTPPGAQWYDVSTPDKPDPGKRAIDEPVFFLEYTPLREVVRHFTAEQRRQPNGVVRVRAVVIGVHDLKGQLKALGDDGFPAPGRAVTIDGLHGREIPMGIGVIDLVETPGKVGDDDDERVLALTLGVDDLAKSKAVVEAAIHGPLAVHAGAYGRGVFLPTALTHDLKIELAGR